VTRGENFLIVILVIILMAGLGMGFHDWMAAGGSGPEHRPSSGHPSASQRSDWIVDATLD
jgi:hypothetical protein